MALICQFSSSYIKTIPGGGGGEYCMESLVLNFTGQPIYMVAYV